MRDQHRALLLACGMLLIASCKKDKDASPPSVAILAPSAGSSIAIPDTITISVAVSDDHIVERLVIAVTDEQGVPIAPSVAVDVNTSSATVQRAIELTSELIRTGSYTIMASAFDGTNEARDFVGITVQAAPLRLRAVFITPPLSAPPPFPITRIDSTGAVSEWNLVSELGGAAIDPVSRHLLLAGGANEPLTAWPTDPSISSWSVANQNSVGSSQPYFLGLRDDPEDGRFYVGTNNGTIKAFTGAGIQVFNAQAISGCQSIGTVVLGELLVSAQEETVPGTHKLVTYAYSSGVQEAEFPSDLEPIGLHRRSDDQALVFGNRDGDGVIQERHVVFGGVFEMQVFEDEPITAVARLDANRFVLALPDRIIRFEYGSNGIFPLANGVTASALAYEPATGAVYVGVGNSLILIDPGNGALAGTITLPTAIGFILPLLNRRP